MIETNPITLGQGIETSIRRYLRSALPISRNYPKLRGEIERLLNQTGLLLKGPYVEALPDYRKGGSLESLATGEHPLLHSDFAQLPESEFTRPLHKKSTRLNSSHRCISYAVICLKKKKATI